MRRVLPNIMFNTIKTAAIAGLVGLTALAAVPAQADNGVILRVDAAFGSTDGKHLYIVFGGVF